jgi:hypothetical protein
MPFRPMHLSTDCRRKWTLRRFERRMEMRHGNALCRFPAIVVQHMLEGMCERFALLRPAL